MKKTFICNYPLEHQHEGTMLGNSYLGLYAWGEYNELRISVGCGALWDHRGGMSWSARQNYKDICRALAENDANMMESIFATDAEQEGKTAARPCIIPVGRLIFTLKEGCRLLRNELDRSTGGMTIFYSYCGEEKFAELRLKMREEGKQESFFALKCEDVIAFAATSSYDLSSVPGKVDECGERVIPLAEIGLEPPERLARQGLDGFVQSMPADDHFGLAVMAGDGLYTVAFKRNASIEQLKSELQGETSGTGRTGGLSLDWAALTASNTQYWSNYWNRIPEISTGSDFLDEIYYDGMFKFGSMTAPEGVPAGLQGPWIEDDRMPPWSSDFHFNINAEMCYWPAFRAGLWKNLRRVLDMVWQWRGQLQANAQCFIGIDNGYMLPHAVDDRAVCMGAFWTGAIDHGCTAWVAQLMYDYADYSSDMDYMRDVALPFMKGAMNVYLAMIEQKEDGTFCLPVTVSPEYNGCEMSAWGSNASFQLAAAHRLARNLITASEMLGLPIEQSWRELIARLPLASLLDNEIALWDGFVIEENHRHHSHLAGICPFDVIDKEDPVWKTIVDKSVFRWNKHGMGGWTGWSMPWASMLESHLDFPDGAELMLDIWKRQFTNKGGGSLHDAYFPGIFCFHHHTQLMQMDATMGAVTAVQDMMLHSRQGVIHLFAGASFRHDCVSFTDMHAPGGFLISASRKGARADVRVTAERDNILKLCCHCAAKTVEIQCSGEIKTVAAERCLELSLKAGEMVQLNYK